MLIMNFIFLDMHENCSGTGRVLMCYGQHLCLLLLLSTGSTQVSTDIFENLLTET